MPPTPVAAPWNGSTAEGWLWLSTLNATASPFAEVDHAGVLARALKHTLAGRRQPAQQRRRVLVAAVLGPEQREHGELEAVRVALEQPADTFQLAVGEPEGAVQRLFRDCRQILECSAGTGSDVPPFSHTVRPIRFDSR